MLFLMLGFFNELISTLHVAPFQLIPLKLLIFFNIIFYNGGDVHDIFFFCFEVYF